MSDELSIRETQLETFSLQCDFCERMESFESEQAAYTWGIGHIQAEHADELPDLEGTT